MGASGMNAKKKEKRRRHAETRRKKREAWDSWGGVHSVSKHALIVSVSACAISSFGVSLRT